MKLIGYVDGIEINFNFYPPNTFKAVIPKKIDGKYIVELKAADDAGNIDYSTGIYVSIDFQHMKIKMLNSKYEFKNDTSKIGYERVNNVYDFKELDSKLIFKKDFNPYFYKELMQI